MVGVAIVVFTVVAAIKMVILPRGAQSALARAVFRLVRVPFSILSNGARDYEARDKIMAYYGPFTLVTMTATWFVFIALGFSLMFVALDPWDFAEAYHLTGSSITTLGFAPAPTTLTQTLSFIEAGLGLFTLTLMITYLPSMYQAFSQREEQVALLEVRAGNPPSAVEFIIRHHQIGWLGDLDTTWLDWERWFADLEESHTTYGVLNWFRSPKSSRSWVTSAGTILDAASLMISTVDDGTIQGPKGVCIRSGYLALRSIGDFMGVEYDADPNPTDPISITRQEFDEAVEAFEVAGVPLYADRDQAWEDFAGWRVNYDTVLLDLAEITMAPYAPWTSDRSSPRHRQPRLGKFGRR